MIRCGPAQPRHVVEKEQKSRHVPFRPTNQKYTSARLASRQPKSRQAGSTWTVPGLGSGADSPARPRCFRCEFYSCLTARAYALFQLTDAVPRAGGPVGSLVEMSLAGERRRGHGGRYDALSAGGAGSTPAPTGVPGIRNLPDRVYENLRTSELRK